MLVDSVQNQQFSLKLSLVNNAILDVFRKFLDIKNDRVLYIALLDYIHCLTNYLRSASVFSMNLSKCFF